jgi:AAHS family 4-hydroxybenzoate transporter-like MFS transporter
MQTTTGLDDCVQRIDVPALIDRNPVGTFQKQILILVGLTVLIDGFDVQAMGYVAPAIIHAWGVSKASLGPVFAAGLFGMLVGSLTLSVLADRIGRRPVLIGATLFFSLGMFATAQVTTLGELWTLRFLTGLGLGAIMPNAMALAGEFSPRRSRTTLMMLVSCGFTLGAVLGGLLSAVMIPALGWHSVFYVGAVIPLVVSVLMMRALPESMQFLLLRGGQLDAIGTSLARIDMTFRAGAELEYVMAERVTSGAPVAELFRHGRSMTTVLLWAINFLNLVNLYFLSNWLPTIAVSAGMTTSGAVMLGTSLQVGGVMGTLGMGPTIDRAGFRRVLVPVFLVGAVAIALIGRAGIPAPLLFVAVSVAGLCVIGGQPAVNALAASYYPTALRSTGVGWSLGIGRIGSIVGPVLGGELIRRQWPDGKIFVAMAVPAVLSSLLMYAMRKEPELS